MFDCLKVIHASNNAIRDILDRIAYALHVMMLVVCVMDHLMINVFHAIKVITSAIMLAFLATLIAKFVMAL